MKALCVAGARPNFMKIAPVIAALTRRSVDTRFVHTGQHYDAAMSDVFLDELGLPPPDHHLGVGSGSHAWQTGRIMEALEPVVDSVQPDVVVVVGDVNSTMGAALVAAKAGVAVAHVEAGLRSRDWSMPEEINRVVTDRVSDHLLAPSADAVANLRAEGYGDDQIHLVGNVMVDTLRSNLDRARARPVLRRLGLQAGRYGLVTLHRPATVDDPTVLAGVMAALREVARHLPLVLPVHPRTRRSLAAAGAPHDDPHLRLIEPLGYLDFLALEAGARIVLTDSGGVQEETTALGVPCLTLRGNTERPVTITEGTNVLVGLDPERIVTEAHRALGTGTAGTPDTSGTTGTPGKRRGPPALWDGHAAERVADVIVSGHAASGHRRPFIRQSQGSAIASPADTRSSHGQPQRN